MSATHDPQQAIRELLAKETNLELVEIVLEKPKQAEHGDYAFPCFILAKELKKAPQMIAFDLQNKFLHQKDVLKKAGIADVKAMGPYLNFVVDKAQLGQNIITQALKHQQSFGTLVPEKRERVMLEYSAPNTNKPQHLGHVRNNVLGMAIGNIVEAAGHEVIRVNWINDRGIAMCKVGLAFERWGAGKTPQSEGRKPDHFVGDYYVLYQQEAQKNPELDKEAQAMVKLWEENDYVVRSTWKQLTDWIYEGYDITYHDLGCRFDHVFKESDIYDKAKPIIREGIKHGAFEKDEKGTIIARLEKYGMPDKVVIRADGTSIYITADLALAKEKDVFKIDRSLYVVGSEQKLYFQQLFKIFELLGFSYAKNCVHISYGLVYLPEGKMKSREGTVVDADDLIFEMVELAKAEIKRRDDQIDDDEINLRARAIGIGALKFYMLRVDHNSDIHYDPKDSISFEGETGPYVQYTYARIMSIIRKGNMTFEQASHLAQKADFALLMAPEEHKIITLLQSFAFVISDAASNYRPHVLARHLLDTAQALNEYYHKEPILKADESLQHARIALICAVAVMLKNGLALLGIDVVERM